MLLAIDAGNTNTVFAVQEGETIRGQWRISTAGPRTAEEYIVWLDQLMALDQISRNDIKATIISTVVPETLFNIQSMCRRFFNSEPLVVGSPNIDLGLDVRISQPSNVGADRIVNAVGAHIVYEGPLIVIDFGTATTFDVVHSDGAYEGGIIAPGVNLSLEALHMAAAQLPRVAIARPQSVVGSDTVSAMQSGVFWGYVALIEGLVRRIKVERDEEMTVVSTGGLSSLFRNATDVIDFVDHDLTIRGLVEIHRRNIENVRSC
jgi:type III pantothenate kinase